MFYTYIKCSKHTVKCFHHTIKCSTINFLSFYFLNNRNLLNILVSIVGKIFYTTNRISYTTNGISYTTDITFYTTNRIYYTMFRTYYVIGNNFMYLGIILYNRKYLCIDRIFYGIPQNYMSYHRRTYRQSIIRNLTKQSSCEAQWLNLPDGRWILLKSLLAHILQLNAKHRNVHARRQRGLLGTDELNRFLKAKLIFISIQISINFDDQFFLIYLRTKLLRINLKVEICEAFYAPSNDIW